jgi:hypothetical protein
VVLQLGVWARGYKSLTVKDQLVTKCYTGPRIAQAALCTMQKIIIEASDKKLLSI